MKVKAFLLALIPTFLSCLIAYFLFSPIYQESHVIIPYGLRPFDICVEQPLLWKIIKIVFVFTYLYANLFLFFSFSSKLLSLSIFSFLFKKKNKDTEKKEVLQLKIGYSSSHELVTLPEKSLYQNIFITGAIGTGKTSSAMYPFTKQLIEYKSNSTKEKLGMLILDVKGNYYKQVLSYAQNCGREEDVITIDLSGKIKYNPLHKPHLRASVLADRLKSILLLFSPNNSESFWIDKAHQILLESIKLCRLYHHGYVTFEEIHHLITSPSYYAEKVAFLHELFLKNTFSSEENYDLLSSLEFFEKEFKSLDARTISILKSEITRITSLFLNDYQVKNTFCSSLQDLNFLGFSDVIEKGKIVVLNLNIADYQNLSKVIAAYLKLDFQTEVMSRLANPYASQRSVCFISDEFHEYVTASDASFFAQSREAKCINIIATQSYTSLLHTLKDTSCVKVIIQNLINKLWFRTDDIFTIEDAQKQIGKQDKTKISKTISENAKETTFHPIFQNFQSKDSNLSESYSTYSQTDFTFDFQFFTQALLSFSCLSFLSDGDTIKKPEKLTMLPYFRSN